MGEAGRAFAAANFPVEVMVERISAVYRDLVHELLRERWPRPRPYDELEARPCVLPNLDGLRFFAFFLVYLRPGFGVGDTGGVGVAFFFVLSGFLITYLILTEIDRCGRIDVRGVLREASPEDLASILRHPRILLRRLSAGKEAIGLPPTIQAGHPPGTCSSSATSMFSASRASKGRFPRTSRGPWPSRNSPT